VNTQASGSFLVLLVIVVLVGGPWWLISNAVQRRRARRLAALRAQRAGSIGEQLLRELGPLTDTQTRFAYEVLVHTVAMAGFANIDNLRWAVSSSRLQAEGDEVSEGGGETAPVESGAPLRMDDGPRDWSPPPVSGN
jgi:hypothetical protein